MGKAWGLNLAILEMACFPSGLPGAALAQLAAIVNPANKPTKVKWSLSWSRALEKCGKAVPGFNKGLVLLGKAWSLNLAFLEKACFPSGLPGAALAQLAAIVNPANKPTQIEMHLQAQIER